MKRPILPLGALALVIQVSTAAYAEDAMHQLNDLVLEAQSRNSLEEVQQQLKDLAGASNLIDLNHQNQRMQSNADLLQMQAGIYAQTAGNEGAKISIRGSGINRGSGAHASGTYVLLDGIPLTGPGGTPYELLEPSWLSYAEVLRGSQGFEQGALALGGAINYVSQTAKHQQGGQFNIAMGSHAYQKYHLSYAEQLGALDYFIAATHSQSDGYQQHSKSTGTGVTANIGYQINDQIDTRVYLRYRETEHQTPGRLTQQQIHDDPEQANAYNLAINAKRIQPGSTWLANQTTWQLAQGGELQASLAYHHYPMDLQESLYRVYVDYTDLTARLSWTQPFTWLERANISKMILISTTQHDSAKGRENLRSDGALSRRYIHRGHDQSLNFQNQIEWYPDLWLITAVGLNATQRDAYVTWPETEQKLKKQDWDYVYRLGLRFDAGTHTQLYTTVSRSFEPAHAWSMLWGSDQYFPSGTGASSGRQSAARNLEHQTATTLEVGGRGEGALGQWAMSYYYAKLKNELLMAELHPLPNQIIAESNASDTIHQGVELALHSQLWQGQQGSLIDLQQAYTFSDFHYKKDALFKRNELAGLPQHYYQAKLQYQHPEGWFVGLNTEYASQIPMDYANSTYADAYHIWGMHAGWNAFKSNLDVWLELKNLSDKKYSSTITPGFDDRGQDRARATPGERRAMYLGVNYKF